jgi:hypothetical protein
MAGNAAESGRSVTSKIASILLTFTESSEHSLTEVARWARLPISTTHRLMAEMTSWRLLERTPEGLYRAGLPLRMISGGPSRCPNLKERALCVLEDLAIATHCRARLGVLHELDVAYIEKRPDHQPVTAFSPAARLPAHPTALGRALLAFLPAGHGRNGDHARAAALHLSDGDVPRAVPSCIGDHPADAGCGHPLRAGTPDLHGCDARVRSRRRRGGGHRTGCPRPGRHQPAVCVVCTDHRHPQPGT